MEDDWDNTDEDTVTGNCDQCDREGVLVRYLVDPFLAEVYPEDGPYRSSYWCGVCWFGRKDEV